MSFSDVGSTSSTRPDRPLIVKATFDRLNKRITFSSARNCSYDLLRSKVEQSFSLQAFSFSIAYKDDDNEVTSITTESDLTEAIQYFQAGVDDPPVSSSQSILSGRSFGSRRITLRVLITVDYDGPSLSDTSSLVSLDEYQNRNRSQSEFSLSFSEESMLAPEDDNVTISSRDTGAPPRLNTARQQHRPQAAQADTVIGQDFESLSGSGIGSESQSQADDFDAKYPEDPSAVFERLKLSESTSDSAHRNTQWLREQSSRTIVGVPAPKTASDTSSIRLSEDLDSVANPFESPFDGDLALQQDNGKYYYTYTSSAASITHDDASVNGEQDYGGIQPYKSHWAHPAQQSLKRGQSSRQKTSSSSHHSSISSSSSRPSMHSSSSDPLPRPMSGDSFDAVQVFENAQPPQRCTDCSSCGMPLDTMRYVCSTCGEKSPLSPSRSNSSETVINGKGKGREDLVYPPPPHRHSRPPTRPLPSIPSSNNVSSLNSSTSTLLDTPGFELCPSCIEIVGVTHSLSLCDPTSDEPSSPEDAQRTLSQLRRAAPRQKGHFRHAYIEKMWSQGSWKDVEQDDCGECTICNSALSGQRYKCASCNSFVLCRACYSQVHEIHPLHAFLDVPDRPLRARSEPDLEPASSLMDDGFEDGSMTHPDVKCAQCEQDIVGARFHCAICESIDICSNCEAAGIPFDSSKSDHSSSHIMIKIPLPLNSSKVQNASRRARLLWTGRDAENVRRNSMPQSEELDSQDATTVLGGSKARRKQGSDATRSMDHHVLCKGCTQPIVGVRYQCASCPSTRSSVYNLCINCEPRSYLLHNPMHIYFKLPRPVDKEIESDYPFLPILYKQPAGPQRGSSLNSNHPKAYLTSLHHNAALCDHCMERISGEWFRCVYCAKDLCDVCENLNAHDKTHFFYVFKAPVDMQIFRIVAELDNPRGSPPVVKFPVYLS